MPEWRRLVRQRLEGLDLPPGRADEIGEELGQHLEDRFGELREAGVSAPDAERAVLAELDAADVLRAALRGVERAALPEVPALGAAHEAGWLKGAGGDLRHGLRALRRAPTLTATVVLTLALGIGANAAIFSVVRAVLLQPLPYHEPERLVRFWGSAPEKGLPVVNYPDALYDYFHRRSQAVQSITAYADFGMTLTGAHDPERLDAAGVTIDFFTLLGQVPLLGRTFLAEEGRRGQNSVAILSHGLWQRRFGGDPAVVGRSLVLDSRPTTVVGVMPAGFEYPRGAQLWMPLPIDPASLDCWCWETMGRLAPGRTVADASRELVRLNADFWAEREGRPAPAGEPEGVVIARPLAEVLTGDVRTPLLVLLAAVGLVLLIACANIANLLLARATARSREIALRCCLGASPWRIVRQLLVESLLLGVLGTVAGLLLAAALVEMLGPPALEALGQQRVLALDAPVFGFTAAAGLGAVMLFGLAPALRGARVDVQEAVKDGARGSRGAPSRRLNDAFVVSQFALALVLLVGAGLLLRSFAKLLAVDPGFRPENVLVGRVALPDDKGPKAALFFDQLDRRLRVLPGVKSAGLTSAAPFGRGGNGQNFRIQGREPGPGEPVLVTEVRQVTPGYFAAIGTPLLRGRLIEERDRQGAEYVAVVDESLARRFWPDGNAIGHQLRLGDDDDNPWRTIVGVVSSVKSQSLLQEPDRFVYVPHAQWSAWWMSVVVRTSAAPADSAAAVRAELRALDPTVPLFEVQTLEGAVERSLGTRRLTHRLLLAFALAALVLSAVGIYGVMAVNVSHRTNEFGIRLALGAAPADVRTLVLGRGLRLVLVAVGLGLVGAAAVARLIASLLFQVNPMDPITFSAVAVVLATVALAACYIPARRATATDPLEALRCE